MASQPLSTHQKPASWQLEKLAKQPIVIGDEIVIRMMMQLSLTYDHRIVDGAPAAQFLKRIKGIT